jgi:hypothetical protein
LSVVEAIRKPATIVNGPQTRSLAFSTDARGVPSFRAFVRRVNLRASIPPTKKERNAQHDRRHPLGPPAAKSFNHAPHAPLARSPTLTRVRRDVDFAGWAFGKLIETALTIAGLATGLIDSSTINS